MAFHRTIQSQQVYNLHADESTLKLEELKSLCRESIDSTEQYIENQFKSNSELYTYYYLPLIKIDSLSIPAKIISDIENEARLKEKITNNHDGKLNAFSSAGRYLQKLIVPKKTSSPQFTEQPKKSQSVKEFVDENFALSLALKKYNFLKEVFDSSPQDSDIKLAAFSKKMREIFNANDHFFKSAKHILRLEKKDPFHILLKKITELPELDLTTTSKDEWVKTEEIINELGMQLKSSDLYEKNDQEFMHDVKQRLREINLAQSDQIFAQLIDYLSLLKNSDFFGFFQAINSAITHVWNKLNVINKPLGQENYLGADDLPSLFNKLLPNNLEQLNKINDRLKILEKLASNNGEDAYALIMLLTALNEKIYDLTSYTATENNKKNNLIVPVIRKIHNPDFIELVNVFATLRPIKNACKNYNDCLQEALDRELASNKALYNRFKLREGAIGQSCLLNVTDMLNAYDNNDPQLKHFAERHTKFRVSIKKYKALIEINSTLQHPEPVKAMVEFRSGFEQHAALFQESEDGPGKRFVNKILSILSKVIFPCMPRRESPKTSGHFFVEKIGSLFSPKRAKSEPEPIINNASQGKKIP